MTDKRAVLREKKPFSYQRIKDGKYRVFFDGREIKILKEKEAAKLDTLLSSGDDFDIQLFLARMTGHFKHGNEI